MKAGVLLEMKKSDFPQSDCHGDAYRYFLVEMRGRQYCHAAQLDAWNWFLAGWQAKCKQRADLYKRPGAL
jgi:hypothetical protein